MAGAKAVPAGVASSARSRAAPADTPVRHYDRYCEATRWTEWTGQMRVTPDDAGSQEARAGVERWRSFAAASAAAERRQTSALRFSARRARSAGGWQHSFAWLGQYPLRLSALRLLSFLSFVARMKRSEIRERHLSRIFVPGLRSAPSGLLIFSWEWRARALTARDRNCFPPPR